MGVVKVTSLLIKAGSGLGFGCAVKKWRYGVLKACYNNVWSQGLLGYPFNLLYLMCRPTACSKNSALRSVLLFTVCLQGACLFIQ